MFGMPQQMTIRQRYVAGDAISAIAKDAGVDRKMVHKYAVETDFNVAVPVVWGVSSSLDGSS